MPTLAPDCFQGTETPWPRTLVPLFWETLAARQRQLALTLSRNSRDPRLSLRAGQAWPSLAYLESPAITLLSMGQAQSPVLGRWEKNLGQGWAGGAGGLRPETHRD